MGLGPPDPDDGGALDTGAGDGATGADGMVRIDVTVGADVPPGMDVTVGVDLASDGNLADKVVDGAPGAMDATTDADTCESRCASGVCDANGDCKRCVKDQECKAGRVCGSGICAPPCGDGRVACTESFVCCNDQCVDPTLDPKHCGACNATCPATQFCANASSPPACKSNVLAHVCGPKNATFLLDGLQADQDATVVLRQAIAARCTPPPMAMSVSQSVSTAINTSTGQPVAGGGELLVAVGGDSTQRLVNYLEDSGTSAVYNQYDGLNTLWFKRRDANNTILATVTMSTLSSTHDYILVQVVFDPISGTLSLVLYGLDSPGTQAGAYYFANTILPSIATYTQAWYLYEWMGVSADGGPGPGDTFTLLASGM
jgi:Stigma-specific protein, Stig1